MQFRTPICDLFGIDYPIFLAGMGQVAYADVCAAVSEAGGFGTLGMVGASPQQIRAEMRKVQGAHRRSRSASICCRRCRIRSRRRSTSSSRRARRRSSPGSASRARWSAAATPAASRWSRCAAPSTTRARAEDAGCDVVVAQGTEAGGHTGKVAAMALIPQTVDAVRIPVLAAGSIVDGRGFVAALALGAQGVWMGTRFIASERGARGAAVQGPHRRRARRRHRRDPLLLGQADARDHQPLRRRAGAPPGGDQALSRAAGAQRHGRRDELRRRRRHRSAAHLHAGGAGDRRHPRHRAGGRDRGARAARGARGRRAARTSWL